MVKINDYKCDKCRYRKNRIRCGCCIYVESRFMTEGFIPRIMLLPQQDMFGSIEERRDGKTN